VIFAKRIRKKDFSRVAAPVCRATAQAGGRYTPKKAKAMRLMRSKKK
jgi:hypothetical protein